METQTAATGDDDSLVVERVVGIGNTLIGAAGRRVEFGRTLHRWRFVRPVLIELLSEGIELSLLLQEIGAGGSSGFLLEREMHAFMTSVLLWMAGANAFDGDAQTQPPDRELGEIEQTIRRRKGDTVVGTDGLRQTPFLEKTLKGHKCGVFAIRFHGLAQQQKTRSVVGDGEWITVASV